VRHRAAQGRQPAGALALDEDSKSCVKQCRLVRNASKLLGGAYEIVIQFNHGSHKISMQGRDSGCSFRHWHAIINSRCCFYLDAFEDRARQERGNEFPRASYDRDSDVVVEAQAPLVVGRPPILEPRVGLCLEEGDDLLKAAGEHLGLVGE